METAREAEGLKGVVVEYRDPADAEHASDFAKIEQYRADYGLHFGSLDAVTKGLDLPITAIALAGALAYAHGRRLFTRELWRLWTVVFPAWNVTMHFVFHGATLAEWPSWVFTHVQSFPVYVALFLYGFRASAIWEAGDRAIAAWRVTLER